LLKHQISKRPIANGRWKSSDKRGWLHRLPAQNERPGEEVNALSHETLVLLVDETFVGHGCMALGIAFAHKQKALPKGWVAEKKKKGHLSKEALIELIQSIRETIPDVPCVVLIGDRESDGVDSRSTVNNWDWGCFLRTYETNSLYSQDHWFSNKETFLDVEPWRVFVVPWALFTQRCYPHGVDLVGGGL
jgi:hypothetical protein